MLKKLLTVAIAGCLAGAVFVPIGNLVFASEKTLATQADSTYKAHDFGYQWECHTCGYVSESHLLAHTAVRRANSHVIKNLGHLATPYRVKSSD